MSLEKKEKAGKIARSLEEHRSSTELHRKGYKKVANCVENLFDDVCSALMIIDGSSSTIGATAVQFNEYQ